VLDEVVPPFCVNLNEFCSSYFLISSAREFVLDVCVVVDERHGFGFLLIFLIRLLFILGLVGVACSEVDAAAHLRPAPSIRGPIACRYRRTSVRPKFILF
jgi:hypothetical protein